MQKLSSLRGRRSVVAVGAVGVVGAVVGMTAGAGMFASAATNPAGFTSDLSQCANPSAPVPGTPVFQTRFTVGSGKVSGTIPAIPAATLAADNITPTLVNVTVTTQYNTGRSGSGKTDVATVNLPGHQYSNPLLFNIPPVTNSEVVGTGTVAYSAVTTGAAYATVTVDEFIAQATSTTPEVVAGTTCPAGTTKVGSLAGQNSPLPAAPTAVAATATAVPNQDGDTAPNNGSARVTFTPTAQTNGTQVEAYEVLATDTKTPTNTAITEVFDAPTNSTSTAQQVENVTGLNTGETYTFQVYPVSTTGVVGNASAATTPAITPATETAATTTGTTGNFRQQTASTK